MRTAAAVERMRPAVGAHLTVRDGERSVRVRVVVVRQVLRTAVVRVGLAARSENGEEVLAVGPEAVRRETAADENCSPHRMPPKCVVARGSNGSIRARPQRSHRLPSTSPSPPRKRSRVRRARTTTRSSKESGSATDAREQLVVGAAHVVQRLEPPRGAGTFVRVRARAVSRLAVPVDDDVESVAALDASQLLGEVVRAHRHSFGAGRVRRPAVEPRRTAYGPRRVAADPDREMLLQRRRSERNVFDDEARTVVRDALPVPPAAQQLERLVELLGPRTRVLLLAEAGKLTMAAAERRAEHDAAAGQAVERSEE